MSYNEKPVGPQPVRHISRSPSRIEAWVTHRTATTVRYHFEDGSTVYERKAAEFDAIYGLPGEVPVVRL